MKRWQLTLALALLALGGIAVAGTVPALGLGAARHAPEPPAPAAVALRPVAADPIATPAAPDAIATPPAPPPAAVAETLAPVDDGAHRLHTDPRDAEPDTVAIPETQDPPIRTLPLDPPHELRGCPACGMG
jgi:hypothetical protein